MNQNELKKAISEQKNEEMAFGCISIELFLIPVIIGFSLHSWIAFGISLVVMFVLFLNRKIAPILSIVLSLGWGVIGYGIGHIFNLSASIVLCILFFILTYGLHLSAMKHNEDSSK